MLCSVDQRELGRTPEVQIAPDVPEVGLFGRLFPVAWACHVFSSHF